MLDHLLSEIEKLENDGAVVLLKWDGERESLTKTVWIGKHESDFSFRKDTDDLEEALNEGIKQYELHHGKDD